MKVEIPAETLEAVKKEWEAGKEKRPHSISATEFGADRFIAQEFADVPALNIFKIYNRHPGEESMAVSLP